MRSSLRVFWVHPHFDCCGRAHSPWHLPIPKSTQHDQQLSRHSPMNMHHIPTIQPAITTRHNHSQTMTSWLCRVVPYIANNVLNSSHMLGVTLWLGEIWHRKAKFLIFRRWVKEKQGRFKEGTEPTRDQCQRWGNTYRTWRSSWFSNERNQKFALLVCDLLRDLAEHTS